MDEQVEIVTVEPEIRLGVLAIKTPDDMVRRASEVATSLARVVDDKKLFSVISGKKFVHVEGWATLGAMLGIVAREVPGSIIEHENGDFEASVELIRVSDGKPIGFGSALCGCDEVDRSGKATWGNRARYARRSMAVTRAAGKAFRLSLSWIMKLAGYEPTPAEEMQDELGPKWEQKPISDDGNGKGKSHEEIKVITWPAEVITWAVQELGVKSHQVVGALNQSNLLKPDMPAETIKHWLAIRKVERDNGVEGQEATSRADADLQATIESA